MKRILLILTVLALPVLVFSENLNVASPYSRYGYGDLQPMSVGPAKSMGGLGYGIRDHRFINPMNPASYSSIDSLTFMMNFALSGTVNGISNGSQVYNQFRGKVDYVTFQFPVYKFIGLSFGIMPFSCVGYKYSQTDSIPDVTLPGKNTPIKQSFEGSGGFTQVYLGISFDIMNRVSVGVNGRYMFGEISHARSATFEDKPIFNATRQSHYTNVSSFLCDLGLLYHQPIKKDELVIGATYSFKLPMPMTSQIVTQTNSQVTDDSKYDFDYPMTVGVGVSYKFLNRVVAGVDFEWRDWSKARYFSVSDTLKTTYRVAAGVEYVNKPGSKKYGENLRYRLGFNYGKSYTKINGYTYDEFAITAGLGFPLFNNLTTLNVYLEYGHRGNINQVGLVEDYFKFGLDISLNERWFVKRKLK